jgi:hypothetical protein
MFTFCTGAFTVAGPGRPDSGQAEDAANRRCRDGFEGLAARGTGRQGFGQVIKAIRIHLGSFLFR